MDTFLTILAIVAQSLDAANTCRGLRNGAVEMNPIFGKHPSCEKVIAIKAAALFPIFSLPKGPARLGVQLGNIAAGSIGFTVSIALRD